MKLNWKTCIGTMLLAGTLFAGAPAAFGQVSVGIVIGAPPSPRVYAVRPVCPGPEAEYSWVEGYWFPVSGRYVWHRGYWTLRPYEGAVWVVPHYEGGRYYGGTGTVPVADSSMTITGIAIGTVTADGGTTTITTTTASTKGGTKTTTSTTSMTATNS